MKNRFLNVYVVAFYLCSTAVMLAGPGSTTGGGPGLEGDSGDNTGDAPINDYIWVLAAIVLVYAFLKFRAIQKNRIQG